MWLSNSSVGRKVVMSVTGIALVLFLTFHMAMNLVALVSANGYNMVCEFLGANWYALVATVGLAALFIIHIIYAFWLTMQNRKARGNERYAVVDKPKTVEWASQNMLVLGIIVIVGLGLHLVNVYIIGIAVRKIHGHFLDVGIAFRIDGPERNNEIKAKQLREPLHLHLFSRSFGQFIYYVCFQQPVYHIHSHFLLMLNPVNPSPRK